MLVLVWVYNQPPFLAASVEVLYLLATLPASTAGANCSSCQMLIQLLVLRKISSPNTPLRAGRNCGKFILLNKLSEQLKN